MTLSRSNAGPGSVDETRFAWFEGLTAAQSAAVVHDEGHLLIVAGAGTGKTRTLAARVADLIHRGVDPTRVLLLTFSRRASREMVNRVGSMVGSQAANRIWGGTFHAIGHQLLRRFGSLVGLAPSFTVLDRADAIDLMGMARSSLGFSEKQSRRFPRRETLMSVYSRVASTQTALNEVLVDEFPWCHEQKDEIAAIFGVYQEMKRDRFVLDFDDLLLFFLALVRSSAGTGQIRGLFDHVLVDEFQDVNVTQSLILTALADSTTIVTAVGDDAQSIYGFRGASPAAMSNFEADFSDASVVTLDENFRSTPQILRVANAVISTASDLREKVLWTERQPGVESRLTSCLDEASQANEICTNILEWRESGIDLREQAVLFRTAHHSDALEIELARRRIPYVKYGGLKFLEAAHVKDLIAVLRILENPRDDLAWTRTLGLIDGIGQSRTAKILARLEIAAGPIDQNDLIRRLRSTCDIVPGAAESQLACLTAALADCWTEADRSGPAAQIERIREFCDDAFRRRYANAESRVADIDQLQGMALGCSSRADFLAELVLDPPSSTSDLAGSPSLDDDYLILSTIHSAKGGEWRVVHLMHAADGCIPSDLATGSAAGIAEERRLIYVAITRARDALHVTYPLRFYHEQWRNDDPHSYALPSRFLDPAIPHLVVSAAGVSSLSGSGDSNETEGSAVNAVEIVDSGLSALWA